MPYCKYEVQYKLWWLWWYSTYTETIEAQEKGARSRLRKGHRSLTLDFTSLGDNKVS